MRVQTVTSSPSIKRLSSGEVTVMERSGARRTNGCMHKHETSMTEVARGRDRQA